VFPVEITLSDDVQIAHEMEAMRAWLDHHRFEPSTFRCNFAQGKEIVLRVDFKVEAEAIQFANTFGGKVLRMAG
jgi:hypothetical protein